MRQAAPCWDFPGVDRILDRLSHEAKRMREGRVAPEVFRAYLQRGMLELTRIVDRDKWHEDNEP